MPAPTQGSFMLAHLGQEYGPYGFQQLQQMALAGQLKGDATLRESTPGRLVPRQAAARPVQPPRVADHVLLSAFLGGFGVDRFYLGQTGSRRAQAADPRRLRHLVARRLLLILLRKIPDADGARWPDAARSAGARRRRAQRRSAQPPDRPRRDVVEVPSRGSRPSRPRRSRGSACRPPARGRPR